MRPFVKLLWPLVILQRCQLWFGLYPRTVVTFFRLKKIVTFFYVFDVFDIIIWTLFFIFNAQNVNYKSTKTSSDVTYEQFLKKLSVGLRFRFSFYVFVLV